MRVQPTFDLGWVDEKPTKKRPPDSAIFIAYVGQKAPELIRTACPIHKTATGYATNSSPYHGVGQFEINLKNNTIIHRHTNPVLVGTEYEYPLVSDVYNIEFKDDMMIVK